jgi:hypothetical protein
MTTKIPFALLLLFASLTGCAKDRSLAPPPDSEQMTVTIKMPDELKAKVMKAMYRSAICKFITHGASGQVIELEGYHGITEQFERRGQSDLYQVKLPMDGGGACKWHLSNITFGVAYANPANFGTNVTYGAGGGVVVMFDNNRPSRSGGFIREVEGDVMIKKDYYPWVSDLSSLGYGKDVSLVSQGHIYVTYRSWNARNVYFEPIVHSKFLTRSEPPKERKPGNRTLYTYPDGSVGTTRSYGPDFRKLEAIRLAAEKD